MASTRVPPGATHTREPHPSPLTSTNNDSYPSHPGETATGAKSLAGVT